MSYARSLAGTQYPDWHAYRRSGSYYSGPCISAGIGTFTWSANTIYTLPFPVVKDCVIDSIGVRVTSAAATGGKIRLGVYSNGGLSQYPGLLLKDTGEIATDVTGVVKASGLNLHLPGGALYWLAGILSAPVTLNSLYPRHQVNMIGYSPMTMSSPQGIRGWDHYSIPYGQLPTTFPSNGDRSDTGSIGILVQLA